MAYTPDKKLLETYADVLVNFALGKGKGVKKGETVLIRMSEDAYPILPPIEAAITRAGGNFIRKYSPRGEARGQRRPGFYQLASAAQLAFVPEKYFDGLVAEADHVLTMLTDIDDRGFAKIPPQNIVAFTRGQHRLPEKYLAKEEWGKLTWTLALFGTPHGAKKAGMSERAYWEQIVNGCFLNARNPVAKWKAVFAKMETFRAKLTAMRIESLRVEGADAEMTIRIGEKRRWSAGGGANIPSFEIFTSPDWRGTEGWARFSEPLLRYGTRIEGIELAFKKGKVVRARAKKGEATLREMLKQKNADKLGEFSLTDARFSPITKFMAHTLFDENAGGAQGNFHIAVGRAYKTCYDGDPAKVSAARWRALGYNESPEHTDIVSRARRTVTARLGNGVEKVIYKDGRFTL